MSTPRIFTYVTSDPDAPPHRRAAAAMDGSAPGRHWVSVGATPEAAAANLTKWWAEHEGPGRTKVRAKGDDAPEVEEDVGDVI